MKKPKSLKVLDSIKVPEPCTQSWESMRGSESKRFCEQCAHSVVNLSALTKEGAAYLLENRGAKRLCVRFSVGQEGQVVFKPTVSSRAKFWHASVMLFGAVLTFVGLAPAGSAQDQPTKQPDAIIRGHTVGIVAPPDDMRAKPTPQPQVLGEMVAPQETPPQIEMLGKIAPKK